MSIIERRARKAPKPVKCSGFCGACIEKTGVQILECQDNYTWAEQIWCYNKHQPQLNDSSLNPRGIAIRNEGRGNGPDPRSGSLHYIGTGRGFSGDH